MSWPVTARSRSYDRRVLTSPSTVRPALLAGLVVAVSALTACGGQAGQAIGAQVPAAHAPAATGPAAHLLAGDDVPDAGTAWRKTQTATSDDVVGPCHLTSLVDIGALEVARRTWLVRPGHTPTAVQVVGRFADNKSAWRAHQVLESWHASCGGQRVGTVEDLAPVPVPTGSAEAYRVVRGDLATGVGIIRKGRYLSVYALAGPSSAVTGRQASQALAAIAATF